jgi:hypothetical protein
MIVLNIEPIVWSGHRQGGSLDGDAAVDIGQRGW